MQMVLLLCNDFDRKYIHQSFLIYNAKYKNCSLLNNPEEKGEIHINFNKIEREIEETLFNSDIINVKLLEAKYNVNKLFSIFKIRFFYRDFLFALDNIFKDYLEKIENKNILFGNIKEAIYSLVNQPRFKRFAHLLLKAIVIIEKENMKFQSLPE